MISPTTADMSTSALTVLENWKGNIRTAINYNIENQEWSLRTISTKICQKELSKNIISMRKLTDLEG
jgi:hypothetical protein